MESKYKDDFSKNGVVLIKNFFNEEESQNIVDVSNNIEKYEEIIGKWMLYFENNTNTNTKQKSRIENFINYNTNKDKLYYDKIHQLVEYITEDKLHLFKDKMNWKNPKGKGFKAHQDQPAWTDFSPQKYVTIALFGNNSTIENGCLEFGYNNENTKFTSLLDYNKEESGNINNLIEESLSWYPFIATPRDIVIFDSFVPHRSDDNITNDSRRIFYFTFNETKYGDLYELYNKKKRIEFPPDIERNSSENIKIYNNKYNLANPIN